VENKGEFLQADDKRGFETWLRGETNHSVRRGNRSNKKTLPKTARGWGVASGAEREVIENSLWRLTPAKTETILEG